MAGTGPIDTAWMDTSSPSMQELPTPAPAPLLQWRWPPQTLPVQVHDDEGQGTIGQNEKESKIAPGKLFVVSVYDGQGGALEALRQLGVTFEGTIAERSDYLRQFVRAKFPKVHATKLAETLTAKDVVRWARQKSCDMVLLIGGPPCWPFSAIGKKENFGSPDADGVKVFAELKKALITACSQNQLGFRWVMEEVASMDTSIKEQMSVILGCQPTLIHAGDFGWVNRARFYWTSGEEKDFSNEWVETFKAPALVEGADVMRWKGPPQPLQWQPVNGWQWTHRSRGGRKAPAVGQERWLPQYATGRFATFTTAFSHPYDRGVEKASKNAKKHFEEDGKRFPLPHYEDANLVWKRDCARPLCAEEREVLHGFPKDFGLDMTEDAKTQSNESRRCSAVGNGFHIPSLKLLLALLLNLSIQKCIVKAEGCTESFEEKRKDHTQSWWERSEHQQWWCKEPSGAIQGKEFAEKVLALLPTHLLDRKVVEEASMKLEKLDTTSLQCFKAYAAEVKCKQAPFGPDIEALHAKANIYAAAGRQNKMAGSRNTNAALLPVDLDAEEHVAEAMSLSHPFNASPRLEMDLDFALQNAVRLGPAAATWRSKQMSKLRSIARATAKLDEAFLAIRHCKHVAGMKPVWAAVMIVLLDWPDTWLPWKLIFGFEIAGRIHSSGVLRPVESTKHGELEREDLLGEAAVKYVDELERDKRTHQSASEILEATEQEIKLGLLGPLRRREHFDEKFGKGRWRPLPRHVIFQNEKWRPIDDGKANSLNIAAHMSETIVNQGTEFIAMVAKEYVAKYAQLLKNEPHMIQQEEWPEWLTFTAGLEDMWKGYRQNFAKKEDMAFCVISFFHPLQKVRVYAECFGLPFGVAAVVNQFNRMPMLLTAVARRMLCMLQGHYFDDNVTIDLACQAAVSKTMFVRLADYFGIQFSKAKRQKLSSIIDFLGNSNDLTSLRIDKAVTFGPKHSTRKKAIKAIRKALESQKLSSGDASKLRGLLQWLDSSLHGRPCRGALTALVARQYYEKVEGDKLTHKLSEALKFLLIIAENMEARAIRVVGCARPPVIIYTDCSEEGGTMRLGLLICRPHLPAVCSVYDIPEEVITSWELRSKYINQGELIAGVVLPFVHFELMTGSDVIWFIDNTAAVAAMIKAASPVEDNSKMALLASMAFVAAGARVWFEYVNTKQNPADPLSRGGFDDPVTLSHLQDGSWMKSEVVFDWSMMSSLSLETIWGHVTALGGAI